MSKHIICFMYFLFYLFSLFGIIDETSPYFNTSFLIQYDQVTKHLIADGFQEINVPSQDNLMLNCLLLERPDARCNVILCCGFYPGRKEGLAAFYHLLPDGCNICLFDARGHGKSEGLFLSKIPFYGLHEYKDIIGIAGYLAEHNGKPIIILGMCAGAYHAVRAVEKLQQDHRLQTLQIKGLILDSSIISLIEATKVPKSYVKNVILPGILRKSFYPSLKKQAIKKTPFYKICWLCACPLLTLFEWFLWPCAVLRKEAVDIRPLCSSLSIPISFIHAQNDTYVPFDLVKCCEPYAITCWWPEKSEHACIYLKYKQAYSKYLHEFITLVL